MEKILFSSESVSEGHPDKICDQISDAILDQFLKQDPNARVACETFVTTNFVLIGGEITSTAKVDYEQVARNVLRKIGYLDEKTGINADSCEVKIVVNQQSDDIAQGVIFSQKIAAGDQGIMFGYATNETKNYMPLAIQMAHDLVHLATVLRKNQQFKWACPDMKSQVTLDLTDKENIKIDTILMSIQHQADYIESEFHQFIKTKIMDQIAKKYHLNLDYKVLINPTGRFVIGGPCGDTGLTGRKIIVDTYGGYVRHGGGAFSGKDATKVDRSSSYMARYVAKNVVAANLAQVCEVQLSHAIGLSDPVAIGIETYNTEKVSKEKIIQAIKKTFKFDLESVIAQLDLRKPIYSRTSVYGHFGKENENFAWEQLDKTDQLLKFIQE